MTGIPIEALRGIPLSHFSADERLSLAAQRETKRPEDKIYSLLGIFDIHMPLLYGEGRAKAFIRLRKKIDKSSKQNRDSYAGVVSPTQLSEVVSSKSPGVSSSSLTKRVELVPQRPPAPQSNTSPSATAPQPSQTDQTTLICDFDRTFSLNRLPQAKGAIFDSYADEHERKCYRATRIDLLLKIYEWAEGLNERCIFWLKGMAGTGKSTVSRTVAEHLAEQTQLAVSFFFKRGEGDRGNASNLFTAIAARMVGSVPALIHLVATAMRNDPALPEKALSEQFDKLVFKPLSDVQCSV